MYFIVPRTPPDSLCNGKVCGVNQRHRNGKLLSQYKNITRPNFQCETRVYKESPSWRFYRGLRPRNRELSVVWGRVIQWCRRRNSLYTWRKRPRIKRKEKKAEITGVSTFLVFRKLLFIGINFRLGFQLVPKKALFCDEKHWGYQKKRLFSVPSCVIYNFSISNEEK